MFPNQVRLKAESWWGPAMGSSPKGRLGAPLWPLRHPDPYPVSQRSQLNRQTHSLHSFRTTLRTSLEQVSVSSTSAPIYLTSAFCKSSLFFSLNFVFRLRRDQGFPGSDRGWQRDCRGTVTLDGCHLPVGQWKTRVLVRGRPSLTHSCRNCCSLYPG